MKAEGKPGNRRKKVSKSRSRRLHQPSEKMFLRLPKPELLVQEAHKKREKLLNM